MAIFVVATPGWNELLDGLGDWELPSVAAVTQARARTLFYGAILRDAPAVLRWLRHAVLPLYVEAQEDAREAANVALTFEQGRRIADNWRAALETWPALDDAVNGDEEPPRALVRLWDRMGRWSRYYGLTADWCRTRALVMLSWWFFQDYTDCGEEYSRFDDDELWCGFGPEVPPSPPRPLSSLPLTVKDWNPLLETQAHARRPMIAESAATIDAHLAAIVSQIEQAGGHRTRKKAIYHFDWLVRYQVQRWTYGRIARESGNIKPEGVKDAVRGAAELVGLDLRPGRRGRPRNAAA